METWKLHTEGKETFWRGGKHFPKYVVLDYDKSFRSWHLAPAGFVSPELDRIRGIQFSSRKKAMNFFDKWSRGKVKIREVV